MGSRNAVSSFVLSVCESYTLLFLKFYDTLNLFLEKIHLPIFAFFDVVCSKIININYELVIISLRHKNCK